MVGGIYRIPIVGNPEGDRHPRVVICGTSDSAQCLVVPAYTPGRRSVESLIDELVRAGRPRDVIVVELNNCERCKFNPGYPCNELAYWLIWEWMQFTTFTVQNSDQIGTMDERGILNIVGGLLALHEELPSNFPPKVIRKIRTLDERLRGKGITP